MNTALTETLQLAKGKQYYDHIVNGGTAYQWNKPEYIDFIEYYKVLDIAFVSKLEKEYKDLSPRQKLGDLSQVLPREGK